MSLLLSDKLISAASIVLPFSKMYSVLQLITVLGILTCSVKINASRIFELNGVVTVLATENEKVNMLCQKGMPMAYCGFIHPSGKRYSFSGTSLNNGHCVVTITATKNDSGNWKCHIGKKNTGIELSQDIVLRIVDELVAVEPNITAVHRQTVNLTCVTTKEKLPLKYCRFEPPNGYPFSIDSTVTAKEPIQGKYYYPQNKSLNRGDCAVTINKVKYSDVGVWTCAAGFDDGQEHTDQIQLEVEGLYTMSITTTVFITLGAISIILILAILGIVLWRKRRVLTTNPRETDAGQGQELELQQRTQPPRPSRSPRLPPTVATE